MEYPAPVHDLETSPRKPFTISRRTARYAKHAGILMEWVQSNPRRLMERQYNEYPVTRRMLPGADAGSVAAIPCNLPTVLASEVGSLGRDG